MSFRAHLEQARAHVRQAQQRVGDQIALIDRLRSDGHDTGPTERLITLFLDVLTQLTLHRNELEREAEYRAQDPN